MCMHERRREQNASRPSAFSRKRMRMRKNVQDELLSFDVSNELTVGDGHFEG